eukprot:SAG11_NODE_299_length_11075_cov_15.266764_2_plen_95_part_00
MAAGFWQNFLSELQTLDLAGVNHSTDNFNARRKASTIISGMIYNGVLYPDAGPVRRWKYLSEYYWIGPMLDSVLLMQSWHISWLRWDYKVLVYY